MVGSYQVIFDRRERDYTNIEWEACNRDLAGGLVSGIPEYEAEEEGPGYDTRGEAVKAPWHEMTNICNQREGQ